MEKVIRTLAELDEEATRLVGELVPGEGATLITLTGELGAGKTAFTKSVARVLGVDEVLTSPTFVLEKIYKLGSSTSKFKRLIHIDAYRLESGKELAALGFDELLQDAGNLIMLEWPEKVADTLPAPAVKISILVEDDDARVISYG
ncbi:MAG: tRNA (adenosine(37)-N6)-threonylcarbamoyltransferase complex ATPase subunit type 1 TsaE [Candidatus Pacebacteria bacterium]|nr:tRNA (adenosine(37)-N6)-threonylcarbamoyltransferase complex ATPase subunit type 1 TsaE [Candidatus Paceibacterota bacterium]